MRRRRRCGRSAGSRSSGVRTGYAATTQATFFEHNAFRGVHTHATPKSGLAIIAEDEPLSRMDFAMLLEGFGFAVMEVGSADMALAYLDANEPVDFLFTDIEMPGSLDGMALAAEVKRRWPHVAIVVCSGVDSVERSAMPEAVRFLAKPFSTGAIGQVMEEMRLV